MSELANRIVLVTGASAGIGKAVAEAVAAGGGRVVLNARRAEKLDALAKELNAKHGKDRPKGGGGIVAAAAAGDTADDGVIASMFAVSKETFGEHPSAVIVNAGRGLNGSVMTSDPGEWDEVIRTNLLGAAKLIRAAGEKMLAAVPEPGGVDGVWLSTPRDIVVIGSVVGRHVSPFSSMYGSTKFGVHGMAEGVRRELAARGIRVTLIEPGFVTSEFQGVAGYAESWYNDVVNKLGPVLEPKDVARSVGFVLAQPANVHVSDILIRPTRQDYP